MLSRFPVLVLCGVCLFEEPAFAQAAEWDAPSFLSPGHQDDIGAYYIAPDHGDWGIAGIWRMSGNVNLGARAGWVQVSDGEGTLIVGADIGRQLLPSSTVLTEWSIGVGASIADEVLLRIPFGVVAGVAFGEPGFRVRPYAHPHLAIDVHSDDDHTETDLSAAISTGVDFDLGADYVLRAGAVFGERGVTTYGIGFAVKTPRGAEVH